MRTYLMTQIENHREAIYQALDDGDCIGALQHRAAQKELELLLDKLEGHTPNEGSDLLRSHYYTSKEVAVLFGVNTSSVTREAMQLGGIKRNNVWLFSKSRIDLEVPFRRNQRKRGKGSRRVE